MALVNHSVSNIINGVSQQSSATRLDNQVEEQVNCLSDVTKGLIIRNGFELSNTMDIDNDLNHVVEFHLDGEKYVLNIDPSNQTTPIKHIPLTADIPELTSSITFPDYFTNLNKDSLKILEDKDTVYILNTNKTVGEGTDFFVDIKVVNDETSLTDTDWYLGSYDLVIEGKNSLGGLTGTQVSLEILPTMSTQDITDAINNSVIAAETGNCFIKGDKSNYRITFQTIPDGFSSPNLSIVDNDNIYSTESIIQEDSVAYLRDANHNIRLPFSGSDWVWTWAGQEVARTPDLAYQTTDGTYTYVRGSLDGFTYSIRRYRTTVRLVPYTVSVISAFDTGFADSKVYADQGIIWVTGVASDQTYDGEIVFETKPVDEFGVPQPITQSIVSFANVGPAQNIPDIKINRIAALIKTALESDPQAAGVCTIEQYDNALRIVVSNNLYFIKSITVSNSYDNTSISGIPEATVGNSVGLLKIDDLPPKFIDGFKVRVGGDEVKNADYYLQYEEDYKGWRETSLEIGRVLDRNTMPQIISKEKIRKEGIIVVEQGDWVSSRAGDVDSNKSPSFVDKKLNDIFFYSSRLGLVTDDTIVMSGIDDTFNFYRTTASQTLTSDRVDIKLDSSKVGFESIKNVSTISQKLLINTGPSQSVLLVNDAFDLTQARLSEVSSFSLGDRQPLPVENGLYFTTSDGKNTSVLEYKNAGNNTYLSEELNKHCPTYIQGNPEFMTYSKNLTVLKTDYDKRTLFVQNRFSAGNELLQNAWHKWELPYDISYITFHENILYVAMNQEVNGQLKLIMTKFDTKPQDIKRDIDSIQINWLPYMDIYTTDKTLIEDLPDFVGINKNTGVKFTDIDEAFNSTQVTQTTLTNQTAEEFENTTGPMFYWQVDGTLNTIVFNDGTPIQFGNDSITFFDDGGYRYFKGEDQGSGYFGVYRADLTSSVVNTGEMLYGIPFKKSVTFSKIVPKTETQTGVAALTYATLMLRRMKLFLANSGPFRVKIDFDKRRSYTVKYTGAEVGTLSIGQQNSNDKVFEFPINGKSDTVFITVESDTSTPFNLVSTEWQGQLITKGRNI